MRKLLKDESAISKGAIIGIIVVVIVVGIVAGFLAINQPGSQLARTTPAQTTTTTPPRATTTPSPTTLTTTTTPSPTPTQTTTQAPPPTTTTQTQAAPVRFELTVQDSNTPWGFVMGGKQNPDLTVSKGVAVEIVFTNTGSTVHDFSIEEFGVAKAKTQVNQGQSVTVEFTADKSGTFTYFCSQPGHKDLGMKGNFIVS